MSKSPGHSLEINELGVLAFGSATLAIGECEAIRKAASSHFGLSPQLLKHSDEQTLASLIAVQRAINDWGLTEENFRDWSVISCSRYLGRAAFASVLAKYKLEGPWGVSVQVIPHRTTHGVAGTISLALKNHGPCIGVGGGQGGDRSALLALAGVLDESTCPGAWVVFSDWNAELQITECGESLSQSTCRAAALAVAPVGRPSALGHVRFKRAESQGKVTLLAAEHSPIHSATDNVSLLDFLTNPLAGHLWTETLGNAVEINVSLSGLLRRPQNARILRIDRPHMDSASHSSQIQKEDLTLLR